MSVPNSRQPESAAIFGIHSVVFSSQKDRNYFHEQGLMLDFTVTKYPQVLPTTSNGCSCCSVTAGCVNKPLFAKQIHYIVS